MVVTPGARVVDFVVVVVVDGLVGFLPPVVALVVGVPKRLQLQNTRGLVPYVQRFVAAKLTNA